MKKPLLILTIILILLVVILLLVPTKKSSNDVSVVEVRSRLVMAIRQKGSYKDTADLIGKLYQFAQEKNIYIIGAPAFICHETTPEQIARADKEGIADLEVIFPVNQKLEDTDNIKFYELAGGKMAKILYRGPYNSISQAYNKLFSWLGQNNKKINGFTRELYLNDPAKVQPTDLLTEIYAPIE